MDEKIRAALASGRVSHAYLLTGSENTVAEQALSLAQALLCRKPNADGSPCGHCSSCEKIAGGNHPDIHLVEPDGASIKIRQIREAQHFINLAAYEGGRQVIILNGAHTMQIAAANSLLKSLEEPPPGTYFILTAPVGDTLLPTILSRVVWLRLTGGDDREASDAELRQSMQKQAREFLQSLNKELATLLRLLGNFKEDKKKGVTAKKQTVIFLEQLLHLLRDEMTVPNGGQPLCPPTAGVFSPANAVQAARLTQDYIGLAQGNINVSLLLSVLAIKLQDLYKKQVSATAS